MGTRNVVFLGSLFTLFAATTAYSSNLIVLPGSYGKISEQAVKSRLKKIWKSGGEHETAHELYEVYQEELRGPDRNAVFNISEDTFIVERPSKEPLNRRVNGRRKNRISGRPVLRRGLGYSVVLNNRGNVIEIWGNGLNLKPLHPRRYPNVLFNTFSADKLVDLDGNSENLRLPSQLDPTTAPQTSGACADGVTHFLELAIAYDNSFCAQFGDDEDDASEAIEAAIVEVDEVFRRRTCISIVLNHLEAHCSDSADPYQSLRDFPLGVEPSSHILTKFQSFWKNDRQDVHRDATIFVSGYSDNTTVAGISFKGSACSTNRAYGWVEDGNTDVFIHVLGHILNAADTDGGIMRPYLTKDAAFFSQISKNDINTFVDTTASQQCLGTADPVCAATCTGVCVDNRCVILYAE